MNGLDRKVIYCALCTKFVAGGIPRPYWIAKWTNSGLEEGILFSISLSYTPRRIGVLYKVNLKQSKRNSTINIRIYYC